MKLIFLNRAFRFPAIGGGDAICDVRVYANAGASEAVVLVIEDDRNLENTSITNRATEIAELVYAEIRDLLAPEARISWVEIYANLLHPEPTFDWMRFAPDFSSVSWRVASRVAVEALIGARLDDLPEGDERAASWQHG